MKQESRREKRMQAAGINACDKEREKVSVDKRGKYLKFQSHEVKKEAEW